jgi:hypothetical protein
VLGRGKGPPSEESGYRRGSRVRGKKKPCPSLGFPGAGQGFEEPERRSYLGPQEPGFSAAAGAAAGAGASRVSLGVAR